MGLSSLLTQYRVSVSVTSREFLTNSGQHTLYRGQFTLSTQLIKLNYRLIHSAKEHHSFLTL